MLVVPKKSGKFILALHQYEPQQPERNLYAYSLITEKGKKGQFVQIHRHESGLEFDHPELFRDKKDMPSIAVIVTEYERKRRTDPDSFDSRDAVKKTLFKDTHVLEQAYELAVKQFSSAATFEISPNAGYPPVKVSYDQARLTLAASAARDKIDLSRYKEFANIGKAIKQSEVFKHALIQAEQSNDRISAQEIKLLVSVSRDGNIDQNDVQQLNRFLEVKKQEKAATRGK